MSADSMAVTTRHFRYIAERTIREDPFLVALKREAEEAGIPAIWISPEQAAFMQILLRLIAAKNVVEVGTLAGYSAISMARALQPGGCIRTIELDEKHADFAEDQVRRSDVSDRIEILRGRGEDILPGLETSWADAAFLDADKSNYGLYLDESLRIVRKGGLIMVDNAFAFGQLFDERPTDPEAPAVKKFNEEIASDTRLQSIITPFGDGCWVCVKL